MHFIFRTPLSSYQMEQWNIRRGACDSTEVHDTRRLDVTAVELYSLDRLMHLRPG